MDILRKQNNIIINILKYKQMTMNEKKYNKELLGKYFVFNAKPKKIFRFCEANENSISIKWVEHNNICNVNNYSIKHTLDSVRDNIWKLVNKPPKSIPMMDSQINLLKEYINMNLPSAVKSKVKKLHQRQFYTLGDRPLLNIIRKFVIDKK